MGPGLGYHGPRNTKEEEEETMAHYVTGPAIKALRERKGLTQKQLAEQILVSDKAVSKWETGKGLGRTSLCWSPWPRPWGSRWRNCCPGSTGPTPIGPAICCAVSGMSVLSAAMWSMPWDKGVFTAVGVALPPAEAEEAEGEHAITVEQVEDDYYVTLDHPMSKGHFLSFVAYLTTDRGAAPEDLSGAGGGGSLPPSGTGTNPGVLQRHGCFGRKFHNICEKDHPGPLEHSSGGRGGL